VGFTFTLFLINRPVCAELDFYVFCGLAVSVNKIKFIVHNDINRLIDNRRATDYYAAIR